MKWSWLLGLGVGVVGGVMMGRIGAGGRSVADGSVDAFARAIDLSPVGTACASADNSLTCDDRSSATPLQTELGVLAGDQAVCSVDHNRNYFMVTDANGQVRELSRRSDPFGFGYYRGQMPSSMGDRSIINGVPMRVAQMQVKGNPNDIRDSYLSQFASNGVSPLVETPQGPHGPLFMTFSDDGDRDSQQVLILVPSPDGASTMVLAAVGAKLTQLPADATLPDGFPRPSGTHVVNVDEVRDGSVVQRDMTFTVDKDLEGVRGFYQRQLADRGFEAEPVLGTRSGTWHQGFHRLEDSMSLSATSNTQSNTTVTAIWITH